MIENPTLKMRVALTEPAIGRDCTSYADAVMLGAPNGVTLLDAKWGRPPQKWVETGRGWGRPSLTEWQRGFITACGTTALEGSNERTLLDIIGKLTGNAA